MCSQVLASGVPRLEDAGPLGGKSSACALECIHPPKRRAPAPAPGQRGQQLLACAFAATRRRSSPGQARDRPAMIVLTFISPPGLVTPFDSHTCWTPWSVFQDGSGGLPFPYTPRGALSSPPTRLRRRRPTRTAGRSSTPAEAAAYQSVRGLGVSTTGRGDKREGEMSPPRPVPGAATPGRLSPPWSLPQRGRRQP